MADHVLTFAHQSLHRRAGLSLSVLVQLAEDALQSADMALGLLQVRFKSSLENQRRAGFGLSLIHISACNLASLNLMKFVGPGGEFDVEAFRHACDTVTLAQEIIVDSASYPTEKIARNSHDFRPLGLGYANLGALLMSMGIPYDSPAGRDWAAAITAVMCGQAYLCLLYTSRCV